MTLGGDKPERYLGVISWRALMSRGELYISVIDGEPTYSFNRRVT